MSVRAAMSSRAQSAAAAPSQVAGDECARCGGVVRTVQVSGVCMSAACFVSAGGER
jgi:hypothetical protein